MGTVTAPAGTTKNVNGVWYSVASGATGAATDIGYIIYTNQAKTSGVYLTRGGSSWTTFSDMNLKENIQEIKEESMLDKVKRLPVYTYNFKGNPAEQTCIGPMAQEWHELFPSCKPTGGIEISDMIGVCLSAIKELASRIEG